MKVRVYPMRVKGHRLRWRDVQNGPSYVGTLVSFSIKHAKQTYDAITLQQPDPARKILLPDLYEPVLLGFAPNAFRLRGYEQTETDDGPIGVVQEWHCTDP